MNISASTEARAAAPPPTSNIQHCVYSYYSDCGDVKFTVKMRGHNAQGWLYVRGRGGVQLKDPIKIKKEEKNHAFKFLLLNVLDEVCLTDIELGCFFKSFAS